MSIIKFTRNEVEATRPIPLTDGKWDLACTGKVYVNVGWPRRGKGTRPAMEISIAFKPISAEITGAEIDNMDDLLERGQTWLKLSCGDFDKFNGENYDENHIRNSVIRIINRLRPLVSVDAREAYDNFEWEGKMVEGRKDEKGQEFLVINFEELGQFIEGGTLSDTLVRTTQGQDGTIYSDINLKELSI